MKDIDFKIWSFFTKNRGLTPWKKVDFLTKDKYPSEIFQSNQYALRRPLRKFLGLPRVQGKRNSQQKMKSE